MYVREHGTEGKKLSPFRDFPCKFIREKYMYMAEESPSSFS